jgi:hypothetical protein
VQGAVREYPPGLISGSNIPTLASGSTWSPTTIATWATTISGQPYSNGVYRITSDGGFLADGLMQNAQWKIFDSEADAVGGSWKASNYNNGIWNGGTSSIFTLDNSYYGDWVSLQLPESVSLKSCAFVARSGFLYRAPSKFRIYGSSNGTNWTVLHDQTSALAYSGIRGSVTVQGVSTHAHIALVVSALPASGDTMNFIKMRIFGSVSSPFPTYTKIFCAVPMRILFVARD